MTETVTEPVQDVGQHLTDACHVSVQGFCLSFQLFKLFFPAKTINLRQKKLTLRPFVGSSEPEKPNGIYPR